MHAGAASLDIDGHQQEANGEPGSKRKLPPKGGSERGENHSTPGQYLN
jgi:hypothetical protein